MGISPIALTWLAREQAQARIKALKDAADFPGRDPREADDMRMGRRGRSKPRNSASRSEPQGCR